MKKSLLSALLFSVFASSVAYSQENTPIAESGTSISHTTINQSPQQPQPIVSKKERAAFWSLSDAEYEKYEKYMALEGDLYYKNLSPLNVMALIETDRDQRNIYIAKHVTRERNRVGSEVKLANDAWRVQVALYGDEDLMDFNSLPWSQGQFDSRTISLNQGNNISEKDLLAPAYADKDNKDFLSTDSIMLIVNPNDCKVSPQTCSDQLLLVADEQPLKVIVMLTDNDEASFNSYSDMVNLPAYDKSKVYVEFLDNKGYYFKNQPIHNDIYHVRSGAILNKL